jgi:hypothetical protein
MNSPLHASFTQASRTYSSTVILTFCYFYKLLNHIVILNVPITTGISVTLAITIMMRKTTGIRIRISVGITERITKEEESQQAKNV